MSIWPEIHFGPVAIPKVPLALELWAGSNLEVPPGSLILPIPGWPEDWKVRLALELTIGKFLWFKKNLTLNLILCRKVDLVSAKCLGNGVYEA